MASQMAGTFSYKQDNLNYVVIQTAIFMEIERHCEDIAKLSFIQESGAQVPVPPGLIIQDEAMEELQSFNDAFFVSWVGSRIIFLDRQIVAEIRNQKQQAVSAARGARCWVVPSICKCNHQSSRAVTGCRLLNSYDAKS